MIWIKLCIMVVTVFCCATLTATEAFLESAKPPLKGTASWYSRSDRHIKSRTANGERFDETKKTCASWDFKFDSHLKVTNLDNRKSVVCRVNDRGPAKKLNRRVDLSKSAFQIIADPKVGLIQVNIVLE